MTIWNLNSIKNKELKEKIRTGKNKVIKELKTLKKINQEVCCSQKKYRQMAVFFLEVFKSTSCLMFSQDDYFSKKAFNSSSLSKRSQEKPFGKARPKWP